MQSGNTASYQMVADNYGYDAIGNLIRDKKESIDSITWNVYGKIKAIYKHNGPVITYWYDALGNRMGKVVTGGSSGNGETWYVHDASGNTMAVYTVNDAAINSGALTLSEQGIYGSSRLGIYRPSLNLVTYDRPLMGIDRIDSGYYSTFTRGIKLFELTNHLGNVLATVTDKKLGVFNGNGVFNHYDADIVTATDYYPFGMQMPGRNFIVNNSSYRYGFNGKEKDDEVKGDGNQYDYGFRIYDPRAVRFLSVDPLIKEYPELAPYQFASNRPIQGIDRDGEEFLDMIKGQLERRYKTAFQAQSNSQQLQLQVKQQTIMAMQRRPIPQLNPAPVYSPEEQLKRDAIRIQKLSDAGYNADGTPKPLTKLSENKTWNNFANNLALPLITTATAIDGIYSLGKLGSAIENYAASKKIGFLRDVLGVDKTRNIGILEGQIGNTKVADIAISGKSSVSGTVSMVNDQNRVFQTFNVNGYDRLFDSEVKLLENFAETYKSTPNIEGALKITSERSFCSSCSGVIEQFKKMFPKVKLDVVNGVK